MRLIFLVFCGIMYVGRIKTDHTLRYDTQDHTPRRFGRIYYGMDGRNNAVQSGNARRKNGRYQVERK